MDYDHLDIDDNPADYTMEASVERIAAIARILQLMAQMGR